MTAAKRSRQHQRHHLWWRIALCIGLATLLQIGFIVALSRMGSPSRFTIDGMWALRSPTGDEIWIIGLAERRSIRWLGGSRAIQDPFDVAAIKGVRDAWAVIAVTNEESDAGIGFSGPPRKLSRIRSHKPSDEQTLDAALPVWSRLNLLGISEDLAGINRFDEYALGWPFVSACCRWVGGSGPDRYEDAIRWTDSRSSFSIAIPTRIHWPGALSNLLIYTLVLLPLSYVPGLLKRFSRRARGRCSSCGYDLHLNASGVCPECGAACCDRKVTANEP